MVTAHYSDDSSKPITEGYEVAGFDSSTAGEKTVTVTYEGKTATFKVTVKEASSEQPGGDSSVPSGSEPSGSSEPSEPSESSEPAGSSESETPETGDHSMTLVLPVVSVLALAILGAAILVLYQKKRV